MSELKRSGVEMELLLLRHGNTQWNAERRYLGHTDLPLLARTLEEMQALRNHPELSGQFWGIYCSDLLRCRETLDCLGPDIQKAAIYEPRLREMNFGEWEGHTYGELRHKKLYRSWLDNPALVTPPGGEGWKPFEERLNSFMSDLGHKAEAALAGKFDISGSDEAERMRSRQTEPLPLPLRVLLVTHGGVIRQLQAQTVPGCTFLNAAAPSPGTVAVLSLTRREGQWHYLINNNR